MILAGDIGGTKSRLALFNGSDAPLALETYRTADYGGLGELVATFLSSGSFSIRAACFGVAGPVENGAIPQVNLPWPVYAHELAEAFDIPAVFLANDLEANAIGITALGPDQFLPLNPGQATATGNRAVVSAGTGLGEAALVWDGVRHRPVAGEGGHADYAPRSELEIALYRYLSAKYGHVSYERVCSGAGLVEIYGFLGGNGGADAAAISAEAAEHPGSLADRALDLFASIYGARAGNVALGVLATGGVYLGGGIAPKIAWKLGEGGFMDAFTAKGRLAPLLERIPVSIVLNDHAALLGAARIAAERSASLPNERVVSPS